MTPHHPNPDRALPEATLVVPGGWCAPIAATYDFFREPWATPDLSPFRRIDVDRWLFPRLAAAQHLAREAWRRLMACWEILRFGPDPHPTEDDDL